jgi:hypothetical protein
VQLAEALELADRQVVAGEVQQRVHQHRRVAVGQHEAVAVGPVRVRRVVPQVAVPQRDGDVGHAHGRARVAGVRLLHGVHGQRADRVRHQGFVGHRGQLREKGKVGGNPRFDRRCDDRLAPHDPLR